MSRQVYSSAVYKESVCVMEMHPQKCHPARAAESQRIGWSSMWRGSEVVASFCVTSTCLSLPPSTPGTLVRSFTLPVPQDAASHRQTKGLPVPRRTSEPSGPRSRAQRPPSGQDSPLQQRAPSFCLERALASEMGE